MKAKKNWLKFRCYHNLPGTQSSSLSYVSNSNVRQIQLFTFDLVVIFKVQEVEEVEEVKEVTEVKEVKDGMKENKVEKANTKFETCAFCLFDLTRHAKFELM